MRNAGFVFQLLRMQLLGVFIEGGGSLKGDEEEMSLKRAKAGGTQDILLLGEAVT